MLTCPNVVKISNDCSSTLNLMPCEMAYCVVILLFTLQNIALFLKTSFFSFLLLLSSDATRSDHRHNPETTIFALIYLGKSFVFLVFCTSFHICVECFMWGLKERTQLALLGNKMNRGKKKKAWLVFWTYKR